jgi:hypothetical protein
MPELVPNNNPITANGVYHFRVNQTGRYRVVVGARALADSAGQVEVDSAGGVGGMAFAGASVTVQQDGIAYTDLDPATAATAKELVLSEGNLKFVVTGATGTPSIGIKIQPINSPA